MSHNSRALLQLPLLGSNQDSPDPESGPAARGRTGNPYKVVEIGTVGVRSAPEAPTISPTVRRGRTLEYHREWRKTPSGKVSLRESQRAYLKKYPERVAAHRIVADALRRRQLTKGPCEREGSDCKGRIEAHHDDYSKPLEVRWLCKRHHKTADCERRGVA